jgi:hypothetical protein
MLQKLITIKKFTFMKKILFFLAMLASVAVSAQSTVQITPISATYTSTPTIQFKVSWTNQTAANHRNKVWVFVDFQPVISPTQKGAWQPATITGTVQKTAGTVSEQSNRGFFLEGTTTDFSSTVTVQLSNIGTTKFSWCAYGSDYPPNAASYSGGTYTLKGTQPFAINGTPVNSDKFTGVINSMTDATGCPGGVGRDVEHNGGICAPGLTAVGSYCRDLVADEAFSYVGCGFEMKQNTVTIHSDFSGCPTGWSLPTYKQIQCQANADPVSKNKFRQTPRVVSNNVTTTCYRCYNHVTLGGTCLYLISFNSTLEYPNVWVWLDTSIPMQTYYGGAYYDCADCCYYGFCIRD